MKNLEQVEKSYIFNLETTKIELYFEKAEYAALTDEQKKVLKSTFLFSGKSKCWVSRAKEPNLYRAKEVAKLLGFIEQERIGERLSFADQLSVQAEKAEARADRYEVYAENAEMRAAALQKPLSDMHGDTSFFTQPIISGHSGSQSFARYRERLFEKYRQGFEEYRKSNYFKEKAQTVRATASMNKLNNKGYLDRKIKECQKEIRQREKNLISYENILQKIENGESPKNWKDEIYTEKIVTDWLTRKLELIAVAQDKEGFYKNCLDELGGVSFSKDNIQVGYLVVLDRWGTVAVTGRGSKNITYKILTGGAAGMGGKASYAEILEIKSTEI